MFKRLYNSSLNQRNAKYEKAHFQCFSRYVESLRDKNFENPYEFIYQPFLIVNDELFHKGIRKYQNNPIKLDQNFIEVLKNTIEKEDTYPSWYRNNDDPVYGGSYMAPCEGWGYPDSYHHPMPMYAIMEYFRRAYISLPKIEEFEFNSAEQEYMMILTDFAFRIPLITQGYSYFHKHFDATIDFRLDYFKQTSKEIHDFFWSKKKVNEDQEFNKNNLIEYKDKIIDCDFYRIIRRIEKIFQVRIR